MQDCVPLARAAVSEAALEAVDRIAKISVVHMILLYGT